jgi:Transglutaminase-like superfamily
MWPRRLGPGFSSLEGVLGDGLRIVALLPLVEIARRRFGPRPLVGALRDLGSRGKRRSDSDRLLLRRLIGAIDRRLPDGGNCFRRTLLEIGLDPASAQEPVYFGLRKQGGPKSGHAWLRGDREPDQRYDAEFAL